MQFVERPKQISMKEVLQYSFVTRDCQHKKPGIQINSKQIVHGWSQLCPVHNNGRFLLEFITVL